MFISVYYNKFEYLSKIILYIIGASWQPPPGYYPSSAISYQQEPSTTIIVPEIILVGACPACRVSNILDLDFKFRSLEFLPNKKTCIKKYLNNGKTKRKTD